MNMIERIKHFLGHHDAPDCLGSVLTTRGPEYLYQCKRCQRTWTERWRK